MTLLRRQLPLSALAWAAPSPAREIPETFPAHPPALAREVVTVAHFDLKRVRELVGARPALACAAVDWGFGDWEDALGAASHVGNRAIAEFLLEQGARPTIFSAAMLGQLDVVKAFVAAAPGVQRIAGPHSISLLAHARAGGKAAEGVFEYLRSLGDAGPAPAPAVTKEVADSLVGTYRFGAGPKQRIVVSEKNGQLMFTREGAPGRGLIHLGDGAFHPAGARSVEVRFGSGHTLTVHDGNLVVTAKRE